MREIKFRAWDKRGKFMFLVREMFWLNKGLEVDDGATVRDCVAGKTGELMQYTELKDKNGKEIYEGDMFWWDWHGSPILRTAEFYNGCFVGRDIEHIIPMEHLGDFSLEQIEVIGNIYENPELLEEKCQI